MRKKMRKIKKEKNLTVPTNQLEFKDWGIIVHIWRMTILDWHKRGLKITEYNAGLLKTLIAQLYCETIGKRLEVK